MLCGYGMLFSWEKTVKLGDLSGKSSIPAQFSKIKIKKVDAVSFIDNSPVLCLLFLSDGPF